MNCRRISAGVTQRVPPALNKERKERPPPLNASPSTSRRWSRLSARWIETTPSRATSSTTASSQRCSTTQISPSKTTQVGKQIGFVDFKCAAEPGEKRREEWWETAFCVLAVFLMKVPLSQHPSEPLQSLQLRESSWRSSTENRFQSDCLGAVASHSSQTFFFFFSHPWGKPSGYWIQWHLKTHWKCN